MASDDPPEPEPEPEPAPADAVRRLVGWTSTRVEAPVPAGFPDETDYYVAVAVAAPARPFLTVGRVPRLARLRRWLAARTGLGARAVPDPYVRPPPAVERTVADRIAAGLDPEAVADRVDEERSLLAAGRHDTATAARNRRLPVGLCVVRPDGDAAFAVEYGWFEAYR